MEVLVEGNGNSIEVQSQRRWVQTSIRGGAWTTWTKSHRLRREPSHEAASLHVPRPSWSVDRRSLQRGVGAGGEPAVPVEACVVQRVTAVKCPGRSLHARISEKRCPWTQKRWAAAVPATHRAAEENRDGAKAPKVGMRKPPFHLGKQAKP